MFPNIRAVAAANSDLVALIGNKFYKFGMAPPNVVAPYVTWYTVFGDPQNQLADTPAADRYTIQVDCWADNSEQAEDVATAVRNCFEPIGYMTSSGNSRDPATLRFRIMLQFSIWSLR